MRETDRRVKYTKMVLRESLLELLQEKPINRISVTELCQNADVNRGTFYAHYTEPQDLLKQIEDEMFESIRSCFAENADKSLEQTNLDLLKILYENRELCRVVFSQNASSCFLCRLHEMSTEFFAERWKCKIEKMGIPVDFLYRFIATGNIEVIRMWIMNDDGRTPEEISGIITKLASNVMRACDQGDCCC